MDAIAAIDKMPTNNEKPLANIKVTACAPKFLNWNLNCHSKGFWGFGVLGFRSGGVSKGGGSKDWESTEKVETYL